MELANKKQIGTYFKSDLDKNKSEIASLKADIVKKEKEVNALYSTYITEAEGTAGTKKLGKGPVYKEKREKHDASLKEFAELKTINEAKIAEKEKTGKQLQADLDKKVSQTQPIKQEEAETAMKATLEQNKYQRELLIKTSAEMHDRVYADIAEDKSLYDLQRKNAKELLELQSNNFVEKQKATL
ncbi:hypothetical protein D3C87_1397290 [compost metagenome]